MKKRKIFKSFALVMALVMTLSMAFYGGGGLSKAAGSKVTFRDGDKVVSSVTVDSGSAVESVAAPEEDGMLFARWFTADVGVISDVSAALNYAYNFSSAVSSDIILYAGWINVGTGDSSGLYLKGVQYRPVTANVTAGIRFMTEIKDSLVNDVIALNSANSNIRPVSADQKGIGYGTVLTYAENLSNGEMLVKDEAASRMSTGFVVLPAVNTYSYGNGSRIYTALVTDIPESYYTQHIAARPYITYADANGEVQTYYYTETSDTTHKAGGAYYINYREAVNNALDDDAIKVTESTTEAPTVAPTTEAPTTEETSQYVPVYRGGYDLTITDVKWTPENPTPGSQVVFTVTVMNDGDTAVPSGTTIGYQIQINGSTSNILWCDTYDGGLQPGQTIDLTCNSGSSNVNYWTATQGSHSFTAWVDDVNRFTNEVDENNNKFTVNIDVNNTVTTTQASTEAPTQAPTTQAALKGYDLTVTNISWDSSKAVAGSQVVFTVTVKNVGDTDIPSGTTIGYQIQIDGNTSNILWCDTYGDGLKAGQTVDLTCSSGSNNVNYWTAVSGSHSVMAWVDDVDRFPNEIDENNNQYTATINVQNAQETQAPTQAPSNNVTIYFHANGWSRADLWYWNGASGDAYSSTWPGVALSKVSGTNGWWTITVNETNFAGYIQQGSTNVGTDCQFADITSAGTYYIVYNGSTETKYTSQSEAESAAGESLNGSVTTPTQSSTEAPQPSTGSSEDGRVVGYNVPSGKTTSSNVSMSANGVSVGVFDTTVNNSHTWVGYYPPLSSARLAIFDFDGTANVTLTVNYSVSSATIRPLADGVTPTITQSGSTTYISFSIKQAGQYSVELNGNLEDAIMIFASEIEDAPTGNVIKVSSGEARYDSITVGNGQTLYIEGGGAVYGRVFCQTGSTVCGRGIIDQSHMETWGGSNGQYPMSIEGCSNVHVSGVSVLNSSCWNYQIWNASYVYLDNIKIVSARPNGDGVSIQSSSNVYVNDSFIRTWDDGIVLKNYTTNNTHDVYCDNIVFWTDLAQSMEIGVETNAGYSGTPANPAIYNVEFTNIDVIHERHKAAISIHNGDNANIYNVKWENVNIEDFTYSGDGWNYWLDFTTCYPTDFGGSSAWAHNWDGTGTIHDVVLNNIKVTSSTNAGHRVWDYWASQNRGYSIYNITCTNVTVNGAAFKY